MPTTKAGVRPTRNETSAESRATGSHQVHYNTMRAAATATAAMTERRQHSGGANIISQLLPLIIGLIIISIAATNQLTCCQARVLTKPELPAGNLIGGAIVSPPSAQSLLASYSYGAGQQQALDNAGPALLAYPWQKRATQQQDPMQDPSVDFAIELGCRNLVGEYVCSLHVATLVTLIP